MSERCGIHAYRYVCATYLTFSVTLMETFLNMPAGNWIPLVGTAGWMLHQRKLGLPNVFRIFLSKSFGRRLKLLEAWPTTVCYVPRGSHFMAVYRWRFVSVDVRTRWYLKVSDVISIMKLLDTAAHGTNQLEVFWWSSTPISSIGTFLRRVRGTSNCWSVCSRSKNVMSPRSCTHGLATASRIYDM